MGDADRGKVKVTTLKLLAAFKACKLVLDWHKWQQASVDVRVTIEKPLDDSLPRAYKPLRCFSTYMAPTMAQGAVCMQRHKKIYNKLSFCFYLIRNTQTEILHFNPYILCPGKGSFNLGPLAKPGGA